MQARRVQPAPRDVERGALSVARLQWDERPDDNADVQWDIALEVKNIGKF